MLRKKLNIELYEFLGDGDIEEMWNKFRVEIEEVTNDCVPVKYWKDDLIIRKRINKKLLLNRKLWSKIKRKKQL